MEASYKCYAEFKKKLYADTKNKLLYRRVQLKASWKSLVSLYFPLSSTVYSTSKSPSYVRKSNDCVDATRR